jgi:hypothetical protein
MFIEDFVWWLRWHQESHFKTAMLYSYGWISAILKKTCADYVKYILYLLCYLFYLLKTWLRMKNNKDIKAFQIKIDEQTHRIQISQLADDTTPKMRYLLLWTKLKFVSGSLTNRNKTERLWIGKLKHSKDKVEHISWKKRKKTIPSPGIYLDYDYIECEKFNWKKKDWKN